MSEPDFTDESGRKPVCECDDRTPAILGEGTSVQFVKCGACSGIVPCSFCESDAYSWTAGGDYVCRSCGEEILSNAP